MLHLEILDDGTVVSNAHYYLSVSVANGIMNASQFPNTRLSSVAGGMTADRCLWGLYNDSSVTPSSKQ